MIIAYSFWTGDAEQALETARLIKEMGPYPIHDARIIAPLGTAYIKEIQALFEECFRSVVFQKVEHNYTGWPIAANQTFWETASILQQQSQPFLWFEPDLVPLQRGWLGQIAGEYREYGAHNMGILADANGRKFFIGTAVYAPTLLLTSPLMRNIPAMNDVSLRSGAPPLAFDVKAGPEIVRRGVRTKQMQHIWRSYNYRLRDGVIEVDHDGQTIKIKQEIMLLHGCKDTSLHRCVREQLGFLPAAAQQATAVEPPEEAESEEGRDETPAFVPLSRMEVKNLSEEARLEYDKHFCAMKYPKEPPFKGPCHAKMKYKKMSEAARNLGKPSSKGWTKPEVIEYLAEMGAWDSAHDEKLRDIEREAVQRGAARTIQLI